MGRLKAAATKPKNKNASSTGLAEEASGLARTLLRVSQTAVASSVAVPYHHQ